MISKQNTTMRINDIRAYRGVNCGSDHYLVRAKVTFPYVNQKKRNTLEDRGDRRNNRHGLQYK